MKNSKLVSGILLIGIGIIFLMINLGYLNETIVWRFFELWPLTLIVIGINILFNKRVWVAAITWILFFGILIGYGMMQTDTQSGRSFTRSSSHSVLKASDTINIEKLQQTAYGNLDLRLGGANVKINGKTDGLVDVHMKHADLTQSIAYNQDKTIANIDLSTQTTTFRFGKTRSNNYQIHLNEDVLWDLDVKMGAVAAHIDFTEVPLSRFDLNLGAGDVQIIFGGNHKKTTSTIKGGAANIEIIVPADMGVKVVMTGALSQMNLEGPGWKSQGNATVTENYDKAQSTLDLNITMGVGKVTVIKK